MKYFKGLALDATKRFKVDQPFQCGRSSAARFVEDIRTPVPGVTTKNDKGIAYVGFDHLPMVDWDWADPIHPTECITISNLADVVKHLQGYLGDHPDYIRVYLTPSGVHAFFLGSPKSPAEFAATAEALGGDPLYRKISLENGKFWVRVSPKRRPKDFIAVLALELGNCTPDPALIDLLSVWHDGQIEANRRERRGLYMSEAQAHSQELLQLQLSTVQ